MGPRNWISPMRRIFKIAEVGPVDYWTNPHSRTHLKSEIRSWTATCQVLFLMGANVRKAEELERRLVLFAARVVDISSKLPRSIQGRHISSQIVRSGTATASNYGEARG